jgi:glycosyltransferase involved in cell wall biosynthesis
VGHDELLQRTHYLYDGGFVPTLLRSAGAFIRRRRGHARGLRWLLADIMELGPHRPQSWKLIYQYLVAARLADILIANGCRHLHIHFAHVPAQIGMYAAAMSGVPFTVMAHANDIFERGVLLRQKAMRAEKMLTISEFNRAYLERIGVPKDKLAVVRCGVSFKTRPAAMTTRNEGQAYRIGTLGRLVEKKGVDVLIRALAAMKPGPDGIELEIAGDGPLRADLEQLANELGIAGRVRFVGNLPHHAVRDWMHGLDAFVLACKRDANGDMDGIPVVLMEAMSQSVPVISTRLSGIPELVVDGTTGLLAEQGDPIDLAARIDLLLASSELRARLAAAAVTHVEHEFGQQTNLDRLKDYCRATIR